jgi:hypothetical protein
MNTHMNSAPTIDEGQPSVVARVRRLPVVSWVWPERGSAEAGAGCGLVGGACCVGGAAVNGLGLASAASVSSFSGVATPYFIGGSIFLMAGWLFWMARRVNFRPAVMGRTLVRQAVVMGSIYAVVLAASVGIASVAGVSM